MNNDVAVALIFFGIIILAILVFIKLDDECLDGWLIWLGVLFTPITVVILMLIAINTTISRNFLIKCNMCDLKRLPYIKINSEGMNMCKKCSKTHNITNKFDAEILIEKKILDRQIKIKNIKEARKEAYKNLK